MLNNMTWTIQSLCTLLAITLMMGCEGAAEIQLEMIETEQSDGEATSESEFEAEQKTETEAIARLDEEEFEEEDFEEEEFEEEEFEEEEFEEENIEEPAEENTEEQTESDIGEAPGVGFYVATGEGCCGEDPHPVHGAEAEDGSFILCGKSIDSAGKTEGFLLKIQPPFPSGTVFMDGEGDNLIAWSKTFGTSGKNDGANNVAVSGNGVFVAGFEESSKGTAEASLRKYDLATGELLWTTLLPSPNSNMDSAFESIRITAKGGAILGGFIEGVKGGMEGFKSYGNPTSGTAQITYFSVGQLTGSSAPDAAEWEKNHSAYGSIRNILETPEGGFVFLAASVEEGGPYSVVKTNEAGEALWNTSLPEHGEATDIAILTDNGVQKGYAITGHKSLQKGIDGSVTKLNNEGDFIWSTLVGNPVGGQGEFAGLGAGNPSLIFDECWGIQTTDKGGAVMACGTGIEGCDEYEAGSALKSECQSDPRTKWRAMLVEVDQNGNEVWSRTDSFIFPGENEAAESASEYVIKTSSGGYASVIDQDFGIGLMVIEAP